MVTTKSQFNRVLCNQKTEKSVSQVQLIAQRNFIKKINMLFNAVISYLLISQLLK